MVLCFYYFYPPCILVFNAIPCQQQIALAQPFPFLVMGMMLLH